ncbi:hypothetical protein D3C81_1567240 [compost metagenome]
MQAVLDLIPEGSFAKTILYDLIKLLPVLDSMVFGAKGNVLINGLIKRIRPLPYHSYLLTQHGHIGLGRIDVLISDPDVPGLT